MTFIILRIFKRSDFFLYGHYVFKFKNILPFSKVTWDEVHMVFAQSISIVKCNGIHLQCHLCHRGDIKVNSMILRNKR